MWYLSGHTKLQFIDYYVPNRFQEESDDKITVRSGYGERLLSFNGINQLKNVIDLLKTKPTSRRAVIQLFDATDLEKNYASIPCTCSLQFLARDNHLHMFVSMRSNDAYIGLPHDVFSFTMIQELVARSVGLHLGEYKHCAGSLHLYDEHFPAAKRYLAEGFQSTIAMPPMPDGDPWESFKLLQQHEEALRNGGNTNEHPDWNEYWQQLAYLLEAYQASKKNDLPKLNTCFDRLANSVYKMFVQARTDRIPPSLNNA